MRVPLQSLENLKVEFGGYQLCHLIFLFTAGRSIEPLILQFFEPAQRAISVSDSHYSKVQKDTECIQSQKKYPL
jgi:hypothetical protein